MIKNEPAEISMPYMLVKEPSSPSPPPIAAPVQKPPGPELVKKFPEKEGHHIEVYVSYIINPSIFYVRIAGDMEKKLER